MYATFSRVFQITLYIILMNYHLKGNNLKTNSFCYLYIITKYNNYLSVKLDAYSDFDHIE